VDVGFDPNFGIAAGANPVPVPGITGVRALVDTGAFESCIDSLLAVQLNLPVIDRCQICGTVGRHEVNIHLAQVRVPSLDLMEYGSFAGVHLAEGGQQYQALIGRTFLQHLTMTYEGRSGAVTLSLGEVEQP
jgi:predicted aspartyl protease